MQRGSQKKLEERLAAAGKSLSDPPTSRDELLKLLDKIEKLLSTVDQSPTKSMQAALSPVMKALVGDELLKQSDIDIKAGIGSCICEITRITAPEAPYGDDKMKAVFQLIVSSFENLSDVSSRSYYQRASILETVAKVRSCVIMLDLECDQMILEMFNHFFKTIRPDHDEVIFASMEMIMTLVIEESEDVSSDIINLILATLKKDNQFTPSAKKLAERVIQNSSDVLRPYITQAVRSLASSLEDYCEAVALICREEPSELEHSNESILKDQTEDASAESNIQTKNPTAGRFLMSAVSNGTNGTGSNAISVAANSSKAVSNHLPGLKSFNKRVEGNLDSEGPVKLDNNDEGVEAEKTPDDQELPSDSVCPTVEKCSEDGQSTAVVTYCAMASPSQAAASEATDGTPPTRGSRKISEGDSQSESKRQRRTQKRKIDEVSDKNEVLTNEGAHKSDDGSASKYGALSVDQNIVTTNDKVDGCSVLEESVKKNVGSTESAPGSVSPGQKLDNTIDKDGGSSSLKQDGTKKRGRGRPRKIKPSEDLGKENSASGPTLKKDEVINERTPRMTSKGKQTVETGKGSESAEYSENLIGLKINVWWPKDQAFYEGVIASFDSAKKKHKVLYTDGDMEVLNLHKQRWEYVQDGSVSDEERDGEHSTPNVPSDVQKKSKRNTNSETSCKRRKPEESLKTGDKDSSLRDVKPESDSKENKSKSGKKSSKNAVKLEDGSQKQGGKPEGDSGKATSRSNDDDSHRTPSDQKQVQDGEAVVKSGRRGRKSRKALEASDGASESVSAKAKGSDRMKERADSEITENVSGKNTDTSTPEAKGVKKRRR